MTNEQPTPVCPLLADSDAWKKFINAIAEEVTRRMLADAARGAVITGV